MKHKLVSKKQTPASGRSDSGVNPRRSRSVARSSAAGESLRDQAAFHEFTHDALLIRDSKDRITCWSKGAERCYGWSEAEAMGKVMHKLLKTRFPEPLSKIRATLKRTGTWSGELIHTARGGTEIIVFSRWAIQRQAQGNGFHTLAVDDDITGHKLAVQALERKQAELQAIMDHAPALISIKDLEGNVVFANRNFAALDLPPLHEFLGRNVFDLFPKDVAQQLWNNDLAALKARAPQQSEEAVRHKDGRWHTYLTVKFPLQARNRKPYGICAISTDITRRKEAEAALRASEERFRLFMDHSPAIAWIKDEKGRYVYLNHTFEQRFGARLELWRGKTDHEFWPRELAAEFRRNDLAVLAGTNPVEMVEEAANPDGSRSFWHSTKFPFSDTAGHRYVAGIAIDITERRRLENEVLNISEKEQARIGNDLHDGIGQTLTGIASLVDLLATNLDGEQQKDAQRLRELVHQAVCEVRQLSHGLSPLAVRNRGLIGSLRLLAETVRQTHRIQCVLRLDESVSPDGVEDETQLFRIAQEAVSNALRHGRPKRITITLAHHSRDHHCRLVVADNGRGMKSGSMQSGDGIGLRVMAYRAQQIKGTLNIASKPGGGVRVTCEFRCSKECVKNPPKQAKR